MRRVRMRGGCAPPPLPPPPLHPYVFSLLLAVVISMFVATSCPPVVVFKIPSPYSSAPRHPSTKHHFSPAFTPPLQKRKEKKKKESLAGQWTAGAMALPDLPAGLLRAALSSGALEREAPSPPLPPPATHPPTHSPTSPALKQLCRPGSERGREKHTERKGREIHWPSGNCTSLNFSRFFPSYFFFSSLPPPLRLLALSISLSPPDCSSVICTRPKILRPSLSFNSLSSFSCCLLQTEILRIY